MTAAVKNKKLTVVMLLFSVLMSLFASADVAHADANSYIRIAANEPLLGKIVSEANKTAGFNIMSYESGEGIVGFNNKEYSVLETNEKREWMKTTLDSVSQSGLSAQRKNKLYNFIAEQDLGVSSVITRLSNDANADTAGAFSFLRPYAPIISFILGMIVFLTFLFLTISLVVDTAYLTIPMLQSSLDHAGDGSKPLFVSKAAVAANRESESGGKYVTPLWPYVKTRVVEVFFIAAIGILMVTGQLFDIIAFVVDRIAAI